MSLDSFSRSTAFRLACTLTGLFLLIFVVMLGLTYWFVSEELGHRLEQRVEEIVQTFIVLDRTEGIAAVRESVRAFVASVEEEEAIYLLTDKENRSIVGNIAPVAPFVGWRTFDSGDLQFTDGSSLHEYRMVARSVDLSDGHIIVGQSTDDIAEVEEILFGASVGGIAVSVLLALAAAVWLGWRAQTRIGAISNALTAIADGNINQRIALTGTGDDLDKVSTRINETLDRLQALMESMRQISTGIAHDLKTPVARLQLKLDTALRTATCETDLRDAVTAASNGLSGVVTTFDALLRIAQIEGGARRARFRSVDLGAVIQDIAETYVSVAEDAGMRLRWNLEPVGEAMIHGDTELLTQLIVNLVENAISHCPEGSQIDLTLARLPSVLVVTIADNGPGIPETERTKVFRRLYRLEKSRSTSGSGLGLAHAMAIADLHGARINLKDNQPGLIAEVAFPKQAAP